MIIWDVLGSNALGNLAIIIGLLIAFMEYRKSINSQAILNAIAFVKDFHESLKENDMEEFKAIVIAVGEPAGGDGQCYLAEDGSLQDFGDRFSINPPDNGALERIANNLDRICFAVLKLENNVAADYVYAELGQIVDVLYNVLAACPCDSSQGRLGKFENIRIFHDKYSGNGYRMIGYCE